MTTQFGNAILKLLFPRGSLHMIKKFYRTNNFYRHTSLNSKKWMSSSNAGIKLSFY